MSDQTSNGSYEIAPKRVTPKTEFAVYFAVIFAATLPLACITWALSIVKNGHAGGRGPVKRAWSQANIITPMIFSA